MQGLSLVAASWGHSSSWCAGLSLSRPLLLQSTGSRCAGSVVVAHGPSCSAACGIFPDQGSNPWPLHWQADSQPLRHQGSPQSFLFFPLVPSLSFPLPPIRLIKLLPTMCRVAILTSWFYLCLTIACVHTYNIHTHAYRTPEVARDFLIQT